MARHIARILFCLVLLFSTAAGAHFLLNLNVRIFHVDHRADGLVLMVRMPMPYLVADKTGPVGADGLPEPAPYTLNRLDGETLLHRVDFQRLSANPNGLGQILADGLQIESSGEALQGRVTSVRVYPLGTEPGFATLAEAEESFLAAPVYPDSNTEVFVGDAVVDVALRYPADEPVYEFSLASVLNPELPGQEDTANVIMDNAPGGTQVYRVRGLLSAPVEVSRSPWAAFGTFVKEGVVHILEGIDHVLFVLCLAAGAAGITALLWRVTGFTLGHSITLSLGFFGFVPSGAWFVPAIETAIAATIAYAAWLVLRPQPEETRAEWHMFVLTALIGFVHGLGFSFVLQNLLKVSSPDIWQSLLAFNIGIEVGQLAIVFVALLLLRIAGIFGERPATILRSSLAVGAGLMALYWVFERGAQFVTAL